MDALSGAIREVFHTAEIRREPLHGGDLSKVTLVTFADGSRAIAKQSAMVGREARMLEAIAAAGMPAARVRGLSGSVLFLDVLDQAQPTPATWARFGQDLARLHATAGARYGWEEDYAFGRVPIPNTATEDWPAFWAERRLLPHVPHLSGALARRVELLARRLPDLLPAHPSAGLLHGDLWVGNLLATGEAIHLIDPASYHGHGEADLAMLYLFGTPGPGFASAYGPLEPGWETRRAVYALFPALVHVRLFGAGYHAMADRFLSAAGA